MCQPATLCAALQVNLFIAVLKIKFAKAQTLFHSKLAKMSKKKRKNILGRVMDKGKKRIKDQVKKRRDASEVRRSLCTDDAAAAVEGATLVETAVPCDSCC